MCARFSIIMLLIVMTVIVSAQEIPSVILPLPGLDVTANIIITDEPVFDRPEIVLPPSFTPGATVAVSVPDPNPPPYISPQTDIEPRQTPVPVRPTPSSPATTQTIVPSQQTQTPPPSPVTTQTIVPPQQTQTPPPSPATAQTPVPSQQAQTPPPSPVTTQTIVPPQQTQTPPPSPATTQTPVPSQQTQTPPPSQQAQSPYSRTVRVQVGQMLEIPYRGNDWVYLGEANAQRGLAYDSRRLDPEGYSFIFKINNPGTYILKFYKQDFLHNYIINDLVQVQAGEAPTFSATTWFNPPPQPSRVTASPRWPTPLEEMSTVSLANTFVQTPKEPAVLFNEENSNPPQKAETQPAAVQDIYSYFVEADKAFKAGDIDTAFTFIEQFYEQYPLGTDEIWWLYGQLFEASSPRRDIRAAIECYKRLVQEYPQGQRVSDAQKRISYLERYYFTIQ
ncbi:hypothetical protein PilKf_00643 [Pillotina sp. SPG140]